jgi:hypothetical protein
MALQSLYSTDPQDFISSLTFTSAFGYIISGGVLQAPKPLGNTLLHLNSSQEVVIKTTSTMFIKVEDDSPSGIFYSYSGFEGQRKKIYVRNLSNSPVYVGTPTYTERIAKAIPNYNQLLPPPWIIDPGDFRLFYLSYYGEDSGIAYEVVLFPTPLADQPFARLNAKVFITSDANIEVLPQSFSTSTFISGQNSVVKYQLKANFGKNQIENYDFNFTSNLTGSSAWSIDEVLDDAVILRFDGWKTNDISGIYISTLTITTPTLQFFLVNTATHNPSVTGFSSDYFSKSALVDGIVNNFTDLPDVVRNWGLLRCTENVDPDPNWGNLGSYTEKSGKISLGFSGNHVDVVVVDGPLIADHPEFALYENGTGGSRVKYYNWYQHASSVGDTANIGKTYSINTSSIFTEVTAYGDNYEINHGNHVAGIIGGNRQGWAPKVHLYSISPQYIGGGVSYTYLFKYILEAHKLKRYAGNMNPTIVNNSWSRFFKIPVSSVTNVLYRGNTYTSGFTAASLADFGLFPDVDSNLQIPHISPTVDQDILNCMAEGIIMIASAGNHSLKICTASTDVDYNNSITATGFNGGQPIFYNRGGTPGTVGSDNTNSVILVGNIRANSTSPLFADAMSNSSGRGPRVDIFAPGSFIASAWVSTGTITVSGFNFYSAIDQRDNNFRLTKLSGTSMAAPQVTGVLALCAEYNRDLNQASARNMLFEAAAVNQIPNLAGGLKDRNDLLGAPNRFLKLPKVLFNERTSWISAFSLPDAIIGARIDYIRGQRVLTLGVGTGGDLSPKNIDSDPDWFNPDFLSPKAGQAKFPYAFWRSVYEIPLSMTNTNITYFSDATMADGTFLYKKKTTNIEGKDYAWYFGHYEGQHSLFRIDKDTSGNVYIGLNAQREASGNVQLDGTLDRLTRVFYYHSAVDQNLGYRTTATQLGTILDDFGKPSIYGENTLFFLGFDSSDKVVTSLRRLP